MKTPRLRPFQTGVVTVAAVVLLSALLPLAPVRDAATLGLVPEVTLHRPMAYVAMAPVSNVLDVLTLFTVRQHIALLLTIIVCYGIWWWRAGRLTLRALPPTRRALREIARLGVGLVVWLAVYLGVTIMPRPMAQLEPASDIVAVDFHAHTKYSHDGRSDWTAEDVRAWHRDAGFAVAYITDHRTFEGARAGWANNPQTAGTGTTLLPGIEVVWRGEHVNVLDADRMYQGILTDDLRDIDEKALAMASVLPKNEPVVIETLPGNPDKALAADGSGTAGIRAIELIDGSPRGLGQTRRERASIVHRADSLNLALVAGSDHHGWGHTAAGWTLISLTDWRGMGPEDLSVQISRIFRAGGRGSTRVVERVIADTDGPIALPFTVPLVAWKMFRTLSGDERIVWLAWLAMLYLLWHLRESRLRDRLTRAA
ncbi:MAG: hypothetical protein V4550_00010 [Gemmatimonadota bacterium]